jgi:adenylate cyclase
LSYTAIGEHVGMAQRMESVAPPDGVMLSESTAHLVEDHTLLGERELVRVKGVEGLILTRRLLQAHAQRGAVTTGDSALIGRRWELSAVEGFLERSIDGHGGVVGVAGPPGR